MIYLDHNATTPVLPEVLEAMMPYFTSEWGNPSSTYKFGSKLKAVIETARQQVAADYLSLTGHKFHAPKGIGALYVRRKTPFSPLVYGGHH